ncbi:MAG: AsnC family transcriptional regulator [Candidatus Raymondbacteria bacterium RifOxyA12_full_50_37]|uniref:AsnC family transcriptional regulator n=1 Tax=Candidatus Raymondbacteria bacterium RIFOXYD12_FULL_49_13 TaxID=1817890 RepID=A0A1F7FKT3_UNCRA|nr:MAG: AsnC family transcriptional regulator [Candidatus Raymondbacteria bacterium RifOxyA12_full_50_37]OGJ90836.1 MAG: AsnC family transcriptional regulator [Candidatus Raymondbacteria bacterium RIFOXYA2_FULL_49_16]OGJ98646.1 MAG: AsnC family transcriptional regulator [Candidatus Raymondbacteria bacterium RIFOXYC2_FULL_50_21]OGK00414.1 MAG: AsnC family transcriptional regulator [Candidatus Raymondbacteria bacterium RifOxyB12_full_50_8]OGK07086.1 MAG: AsnC family transcriptional regulator [Can
MDMAFTIPPVSSLPLDVATLISEIDEFKGRWESLKNMAPKQLMVLRKVATIASIGSSTRIEGSKLSDADVEAFLSRINRRSFQSRDEEEVAGYADAMNLVFGSYDDFALSENHIKQLHSVLLQYSSKDQRHKGEYKKLSNSVEAFDQTGKSMGVVFETVSPFETPFRMQELVAWYSDAMQDKSRHVLVTIAVFTVHFLAIHPFQDGNGRLSRVLTTLMLLKAGYSFVPYCSLESIVEENKENYYRSLRRAQASFKTDHSGLPEWLRFFMQMMKKQKDILIARMEQENVIAYADLPALSESILTLVSQRGKVTVAVLVLKTKANRNTVKKHLRTLVEKGLIRQNGVGKGTWYSGK